MNVRWCLESAARGWHPTDWSRDFPALTEQKHAGMGWLVGHTGLCAWPGVPWEAPGRMGLGCRGGLVATHSHSWLT